MPPKFTMANSQEDAMQMQREFHWTRNRSNDTEHEQRAVMRKDQELQKQLLQQTVMDKVMQDKFAMAGVQEAIVAATKDTKKKDGEELSDDEDEDEKQDDDDFLALRRKRMEQLKKKQAKRAELKAKGHGEYSEITQDEFLKAVTGTELCAVHFYHKSMESCKVLDMHLRRLAPKLFTCKFMSINVEKAPFFVDKLRIRVMPTLVLFKDGVAVHHMVGFDEVGGKNEFRTVDLARLIHLHEVAEECPDSDEEWN